MTTPRTALEPEALRLLRRLRDLNLFARGIALGRDQVVSLEGCASFDAPVEGGVRYRLAGLEGGELLELLWEDEALVAGLAGGPRARRRFPLEIDEAGRLVSRALGARVDVERAEPRALEHVLRRVVRAALR
jgi:hypothetical protein